MCCSSRREGGVGLAKKKGWHARLTTCALWWTGIMRISVFGASANYWASIARVWCMSRWVKAKITHD